jgi:hypothetical protein
LLTRFIQQDLPEGAGGDHEARKTSRLAEDCANNCYETNFGTVRQAMKQAMSPWLTFLAFARIERGFHARGARARAANVR